MNKLNYYLTYPKLIQKLTQILFLSVFGWSILYTVVVSAQTLTGPQNEKTIPNTITPSAFPSKVPVLTFSQPGKYSEYQSYCRENQFNALDLRTETQKTKRIALLKQKISANPKNSLFLNALIKEYSSQNLFSEAENFFKINKDNLSLEESIIWNSEFDFLNKLYLSASTKLEKYLIENPNSKNALLKLAYFKKKMLLFSEAEEIFLDLEKLDLKSDYSIELCEIYTLNSHHADAEKKCRQAIVKNPKNPLPEIFLGISHREREQFQEARIHFEKSIFIQPTEFGYSCLGELFYLVKDKNKTIQFLNLALEKNKSSFRAQIGLALAYFEEKKYELALDHFRQACKLGQKDTSEIRKAHKSLDNMKSTLTLNYFEEIQNCQK